MTDKDEMDDNRKKSALERIKKATDEAKSYIDKNPKPIDGSQATTASQDYSGGAGSFTKDLSDAWKSSKSEEFQSDIISNIHDIREEWRKVHEHVSAAINNTPSEPRLKKKEHEDATDKKWDKVP